MDVNHAASPKPIKLSTRWLVVLLSLTGITLGGVLRTWELLPAWDDHLPSSETKLIVGQAVASSVAPVPPQAGENVLQVGVMPTYTALPPVVRSIEPAPNGALFDLTFCSDEREDGAEGDLVQEGSNTLTATVTGTLPEWGTVDDLDYEWFKDGNSLSDGGHVFGSRTNTLTIDPVWMDDAGDYWLVASNAFGESLRSVTTEIIVHRALEILDEPRPTAAYIDDTAVLHMEAVGSPEVTYQWYAIRIENGAPELLFDGGNISGSETDTLTISNVQPTDCVEYFVEVTHPAPEDCGPNGPQIDSTLIRLQLILDVDDDAAPGGNGSPSAPFATIQLALEQFSFTGGTVRVLPGEYASTGDIPIPQSVRLIGSGADESTGSIIRGVGVGVYPVVEAAGENIEFAGFRVLRESGDSTGFHMHGFNNVALRNCVFAPGNTDPTTGHFVAIRAGTTGSGKKVVNNTIYGSQRIGLSFAFETEITIANNIIMMNGQGIQHGSDAQPNAAFRANDVYMNNGPCSSPPCNYVGINLEDQTDMNGNISVAPMFFDEGGGDYHLTAASAMLIDGGNNADAVVFLQNGTVAVTEIVVADSSRYFVGDEIEIDDQGALRTIVDVDRATGTLTLIPDDLLPDPGSGVEIKNYGPGDMDGQDRIIDFGGGWLIDIGADEVP